MGLGRTPFLTYQLESFLCIFKWQGKETSSLVSLLKGHQSSSLGPHLHDLIASPKFHLLMSPFSVSGFQHIDGKIACTL